MPSTLSLSPQQPARPGEGRPPVAPHTRQRPGVSPPAATPRPALRRAGRTHPPAKRCSSVFSCGPPAMVPVPPPQARPAAAAGGGRAQHQTPAGGASCVKRPRGASRRVAPPPPRRWAGGQGGAERWKPGFDTGVREFGTGAVCWAFDRQGVLGGQHSNLS